MVMRRVVDAGIAVKWFFPEEHRDQARSMLGPGYDLYAPELITAELGNVLWKKVRAGDTTPEAATQILRRFISLPMFRERIHILAMPALDLAMETGRTVYDSMYLRLAIAERCPLVTADLRLFNAISNSRYAGHVLWIGDVPVGG